MYALGCGDAAAGVARASETTSDGADGVWYDGEHLPRSLSVGARAPREVLRGWV